MLIGKDGNALALGSEVTLRFRVVEMRQVYPGGITTATLSVPAEDTEITAPSGGEFGKMAMATRLVIGTLPFVGDNPLGDDQSNFICKTGNFAVQIESAKVIEEHLRETLGELQKQSKGVTQAGVAACTAAVVEALRPTKLS